MAYFVSQYDSFTTADDRYYTWSPFEMQKGADFVGQRAGDVQRAPSRPDASYQGAHARCNTSSSSLALALDDSAARLPPVPRNTHQDTAQAPELFTATSILDSPISMNSPAEGAPHGREGVQTEYAVESYPAIGETFFSGARHFDLTAAPL